MPQHIQPPQPIVAHQPPDPLGSGGWRVSGARVARRDVPGNRRIPAQRMMAAHGELD